MITHQLQEEESTHEVEARIAGALVNRTDVDSGFLRMHQYGSKTTR